MDKSIDRNAEIVKINAIREILVKEITVKEIIVN
jgi:hypothetical protein